MRLVVTGGHLYLGWLNGNAGAPDFRRLNAAGTGWDMVSYAPGEETGGGGFGDMAEVDGALDVLYGALIQSPNQHVETRVARLGSDGSFQQVGGAIGGGTQVPVRTRALPGTARSRTSRGSSAHRQLNTSMSSAM